MKKLILIPMLALVACATTSLDSIVLAHQRALDAERLATFRCTFSTVTPNERQVIIRARAAFELRYEGLLSPEQRAERMDVKRDTDLACGI